jgi:hypothetical protein
MMTIEDARIVDFIGVDPVTGHVVLTITDHLPWDSDEHVLLLQDKLNRYLAFVESGPRWISCHSCRHFVRDPRIAGLRPKAWSTLHAA